MNYYIGNENEVLNRYININDSIYENNDIIQYLKQYHNRVDNFSFFIGLSEEELLDMNSPLCYEDRIICEDWRMCNGSRFYIINRKLFNDYICLRDILEQLKDNSECKRLLNDKDNDNIVLVNVNKKCNSNIHYELYFDNCLE
jgi:hypothetical protein